VTIPFHERFACTIPEACAATGIGRSKLYELMLDGRIETTSVGRRRLVLVPSLLQLVQPQGTHQPPASTAPGAPAVPQARKRGQHAKAKQQGRRTPEAD
jgi:excisionase family DNA binding protein